MYKFAKRLALDARELSGRWHVGMVLRCYLPANVSYWPGCVVVHDGDSCWRSLSIKFNHQINKEKDPNATDTQT